MDLEIWRYSSDERSTLGMLMVRRDTGRELLCFTLEDDWDAVKTRGDTRIPAGSYRLGLRNEGSMAQRYRTNFGLVHTGMIQVLDVPGFEWIYLHVGNDEDDTSGCILVGNNRNEKQRTIQQSRRAYEWIYTHIVVGIRSRAGATLTILDLDRLPNPLHNEPVRRGGRG